MNFDQYQLAANKTAKNLGETGDLLHAALGLAGEAGEFVDCVKKHTVYGQALDAKNAKEELGDMLWFVALGCKALGISMGSIAEENIAKLQKRYPGAYSDEHAMLRLDKGE